MARKKQVFLLGYTMMPGARHPDRATHGEAFAVCWIPSASLRAADRRARADLRADGWELLARDHGRVVRRAPDPEDRPHFEEARAGQAVYVTHESPRFPVYQVVAEVRRGRPAVRAEAHYLVAGETVAGDDSLYDARFWTGRRARAARATARAWIVEQGWKVVKIARAGPTSHATIDPELRSFYEAAEADGTCLVFARGARR